MTLWVSWKCKFTLSFNLLSSLHISFILSWISSTSRFILSRPSMSTGGICIYWTTVRAVVRTMAKDPPGKLNKSTSRAAITSASFLLLMDFQLQFPVFDDEGLAPKLVDYQSLEKGLVTSFYDQANLERPLYRISVIHHFGSLSSKQLIPTRWNRALNKTYALIFWFIHILCNSRFSARNLWLKCLLQFIYTGSTLLKICNNLGVLAPNFLEWNFCIA